MKKLSSERAAAPRKTLTYDEYCTVLAAIEMPTEVAGPFGDVMLSFLGKLKELVSIVVSETRASVTDVIKALKNRDVFAFLKSIGFSVIKLFKGVQAALRLINQGLVAAFEHIVKSGVLDQLKSGAVKLDDVLNKYPVIKKLAGPALAGLLFWMWCSMSFTGDFDSDMDLTTIGAALLGHFSVHDLFITPSGLAMLTLLGTGFLGLSFPWLGATVNNLVLALVYTAAKYTGKRDTVKKLREFIQTKRYA